LVLTAVGRNAVIRNSGIPDNATMLNLDLAAALGVAAMPETYNFQATGVAGLHAAYHGSPTPVQDDTVKSQILATISTLVKAAGYSPVNGTPEIVGFNYHSCLN
jgi:hypothetical protein